MHYVDDMTTTLRVPGAALHYQIQGTGPTLLIVMGGGGDADAAHDLVDQLAEHFTVVTYDRRGLSRSTLDDPGQHPTIDIHSDDAHRLLAAVTTEPAFVLATSLGALIALDLVARHPDQIRLLVAHEPPAAHLLPASEQAAIKAVQRTIEQGSRGREWAQAMQRIGVDHTDREPGVVIAEPTPQQLANSEFFRARDAVAAHRYQLDLDRLRPAASLIVAAGGEKSRTAFPYRCARTLADRLGSAFVEFPGDHAGFATQPKAFAVALTDVFGV
jgi:pimeloyl-ACP methyl ester carboxylesterase